MLKTVSAITNAIGALNYKGTWNASTNTPAIASGAGTKGDYYVVSVAGTTDIDGIAVWNAGDWITFNGTTWQRVEGGNEVPVQYLVIAGGGGGRNNGAGGGGAGGYRCNVDGELSGGNAGAEPPMALQVNQAYAVTVGAGGAANSASGGSPSVFAYIRSNGGAVAGSGGGTIGIAGGSGGGSKNATGFAGPGSSGQGYQGGNGGTDDTGGGGGGAAFIGGPGVGNVPGAGGAGIFSSITGASVQRGGGGGGGRHMVAGAGGAGGGGGGGKGGDYDASPGAGDGVAGSANTGGGGGGGGGRNGINSGIGAAGGSGLVVIKIPSAYTATFSAGVTQTNSTAGGFTTYVVTATSTTSETVTFS